MGNAGSDEKKKRTVDKAADPHKQRGLRGKPVQHDANPLESPSVGKKDKRR